MHSRDAFERNYIAADSLARGLEEQLQALRGDAEQERTAAAERVEAVEGERAAIAKELLQAGIDSDRQASDAEAAARGAAEQQAAGERRVAALESLLEEAQAKRAGTVEEHGRKTTELRDQIEALREEMAGEAKASRERHEAALLASKEEHQKVTKEGLEAKAKAAAEAEEGAVKRLESSERLHGERLQEESDRANRAVEELAAYVVQSLCSVSLFSLFVQSLCSVYFTVLSLQLYCSLF